MTSLLLARLGIQILGRRRCPAELRVGSHTLQIRSESG